jgi:hypothetical protein
LFIDPIVFYSQHGYQQAYLSFYSFPSSIPTFLPNIKRLGQHLQPVLEKPPRDQYLLTWKRMWCVKWRLNHTSWAIVPSWIQHIFTRRVQQPDNMSLLATEPKHKNHKIYRHWSWWLKHYYFWAAIIALILLSQHFSLLFADSLFLAQP